MAESRIVRAHRAVGRVGRPAHAARRVLRSRPCPASSATAAERILERRSVHVPGGKHAFPRCCRREVGQQFAFRPVEENVTRPCLRVNQSQTVGPNVAHAAYPIRPTSCKRDQQRRRRTNRTLRLPTTRNRNGFHDTARTQQRPARQAADVAGARVAGSLGHLAPRNGTGGYVAQYVTTSIRGSWFLCPNSLKIRAIPPRSPHMRANSSLSARDFDAPAQSRKGRVAVGSSASALSSARQSAANPDSDMERAAK